MNLMKAQKWLIGIVHSSPFVHFTAHQQLQVSDDLFQYTKPKGSISGSLIHVKHVKSDSKQKWMSEMDRKVSCVKGGFLLFVEVWSQAFLPSTWTPLLFRYRFQYTLIVTSPSLIWGRLLLQCSNFLWVSSSIKCCPSERNKGVFYFASLGEPKTSADIGACQRL